jgi:hypothetical protein
MPLSPEQRQRVLGAIDAGLFDWTHRRRCTRVTPTATTAPDAAMSSTRGRWSGRRPTGTGRRSNLRRHAIAEGECESGRKLTQSSSGYTRGTERKKPTLGVAAFFSHPHHRKSAGPPTLPSSAATAHFDFAALLAAGWASLTASRTCRPPSAMSHESSRLQDCRPRSQAIDTIRRTGGARGPHRAATVLPSDKPAHPRCRR